MSSNFDITPLLAGKLIAEQFPEFAELPITEVKKQGHDNRTYRIGNSMLIRMPIMECYALAIEKGDIIEFCVQAV